MKPGEWHFSRSLGTTVQVIELLDSLGATGVRVWAPASGTVAVLPLTDFEAGLSVGPLHRLKASAAAGKISEALASGLLISPMQSAVEPMPHQLRAMRQALTRKPIRVLLADEVGLGKTIEAGLLLSELVLRGDAARVLVLAPKGLVPQWQSEMLLRFGEMFTALSSADVAMFAARREENFWLGWDRLIVSLDSVKPISARRGWSDERIERYNTARSINLAAAGWDVAIIDEAHRVAGYTDQVARHRLAVTLAEAVPNLILLTATPHVGKADGFRRLVSLLDPMAFATPDLLTPERVRPFVARTSKRVAIDASARPLFQPRTTTPLRVKWASSRPHQRELYREVSLYAAEGYNAGRRDHDNPLIFLMLLMQRLASSSTVAISRALEKRLATLASEEHSRRRQDPVNAEFWEADGQEQLQLLLDADLPAIAGERKRVERLLEVAAAAMGEGPDPKLERLDQLIVDVAREENDPTVKLIVFTEFRATQAMIADHLRDMGHDVLVLHGDLTNEERAQVQDEFKGDSRILVSTEVGGEGLNLQVAHLVVNYDLPWNPMRVEQRIGRVDRIGQTHPVRAFNLLLEDSVEDRVQAVLEGKLQTILSEFGVDKLADVLDSAGWEESFQELYSRAVTGQPLEPAVDSLADDIREAQMSLWDWRDKLGGEMPDPTEAQVLRDHPFPRWLESMVVAGVLGGGGEAQPEVEGWRLNPADAASEAVTFSRDNASAARNFVTLGHAQARNTHRTSIGSSAEGQPVARIRLPGTSGFSGMWTLWAVTAFAGSVTERRTFALFQDAEGKLRATTASAIWDQLSLVGTTVTLAGDSVAPDWAAIRAVAEPRARTAFDDVQVQLQGRLEERRDRVLTYFAARRRVLERIGLESVRRKRLEELEIERASTLRKLVDPGSIAGEFRCIAAAWIEA